MNTAEALLAILRLVTEMLESHEISEMQKVELEYAKKVAERFAQRDAEK